MNLYLNNISEYQSGSQAPINKKKVVKWRGVILEINYL